MNVRVPKIELSCSKSRLPRKRFRIQHPALSRFYFSSLPLERPTQSGDLISARTDIKQVCFSERDPPDCRSGSPSLGHSLNPSLSAAAAAIKNMSKEKTGMSQDCGAPVQSLGQDA
ncbi:hypothetical protein D9C73_000355 [Collichthys lucidus]|uniref:Uncharacterized protein n=1 Tax=Collichthys lucidus TaxID=240159 RepID=A0A4U5TXX6_COLLU|nr:hypothetical protein D9C73_000355 [Collichthys lucidus]